jgi:hypothetical protein
MPAVRIVKPVRIYIAPFHASSGDSAGSPCGSTIAAFQNSVTRQEWPYDNGDDPSFYSISKFGGQLSWGVCRQDVRNRLSSGDIVVFFSFRKFAERGDSEYRLCAVATVHQKVSQIELWEDRKLRNFTKYFNLLVRPSTSRPGAWEHFEPTLHGARVHGDWLWRIADHRGLRKDDFNELEETDRLERGAAIRARPVVIADNYVLFSSDPAQTHVLSTPPVVAWHSKGKPAEEWNSDSLSRAVRRLTIETATRANGRRRSLRIRNSQRAHRHIVFELPRHEAHKWRSDFLHLVRGK